MIQPSDRSITETTKTKIEESATLVTYWFKPAGPFLMRGSKHIGQHSSSVSDVDTSASLFTVLAGSWHERIYEMAIE
jgi:hypothetical protein